MRCGTMGASGALIYKYAHWEHHSNSTVGVRNQGKATATVCVWAHKRVSLPTPPVTGKAIQSPCFPFLKSSKYD